jgi:hypothetical protein
MHTSRRVLSALGIAGFASVAAVSAAPTHHRHSRNVSIHDDGPVADCNALHITFDGRDAVVQTEDRTITRAEAPTLRVKADANSGMQVEGWEKDVYSISLCKAAAPGADAESLLSQIKLSFQNGELTWSGPSHDDAAATYLLVRAPKAAALDLEVTNGPLSVYHVAGKITARAQNGPVSARGCTGELDLSAQNGPVSSEDNSGRLRLHAQNGPVSVSLRGDVWIGPSPGLEARAENGPVTLQIPRGYKSGVVVESTGRGPFSCASVCSEGRKSWDDDHKRVEFGSGPTMIRVSVGNGPVSVR